MDKKEGHGVYKWSDGRVYDGNWLRGKQHGNGKYLLPDHTVKLGIWENGRRARWLEDFAGIGSQQ